MSCLLLYNSITNTFNINLKLQFIRVNPCFCQSPAERSSDFFTPLWIIVGIVGLILLLLLGLLGKAILISSPYLRNTSKGRGRGEGGGSHPLFVTSESHKTYHISLFKSKRKVSILLFSIFRNWGEGVKMNYEFI